MNTQRFPLSKGQEALYHIHRMAPESPAYNVGFAFVIHAELDLPALRGALQALIRRHASLRTSFSVGEAGEPTQHIHEDQAVDFEQIDASGWNAAELKRQVKAAYALPFDLEQASLLRARLFSRSETEHVFLLTVHHIVLDGWSLMIVLDELERLYLAETNNTVADLPAIPVEYKDFIREQAALLDSPQGEALQHYWREQLAGELPVLDLPTDRPRPPRQTFKGTTYPFRLSEPLTAAIKALARSEKVTPFILLLAAYQTFLHRYTGQEDILVASPMWGRFDKKFYDVVGYFVNLVVLRADFSDGPSFRELLARTRKTFFDAMRHQGYPFASLFETLRLKRDPSYSPIAQTMFVLQKSEMHPRFGELVAGKPIPWAGREIEHFEIEDQEGQDDLQLDLWETPRFLLGKLRYNTDLFDRDRIERMAGHFRTLLEGIVSHPEQKVGRLPLLTEAERHEILVEWNATAAPYPQDQCIHELFEQQVARNPDAVAVVFEDEQFSYGELNARANRLAHRLRALGVGPEVLVGLFVERSVEMVVGLLAILKAGGAYVPLDPEYPAERLAFMSDDADLKVLLCHGATREKLPECSARILDMDEEAAAIAGENLDNPARLATPDNCAYVIYTSGSTGKPKGVCVEHGNVVRLVRNTNYVDLDDSQVFLQAAPMAFDAATFEVWGSLLNGAKLAVPSPEQLSLEEIGRYLQKYKVTTLWLTAGLFGMMVEHRSSDLAGLTQLLAGGDILLPEHVAKALQVLKKGRLINGYGPTENTTFTVCYTVPVDIDTDRSIPIGTPVSNTQVYILDDQMQPVPIGVSGELYAGGAGVARGYLNRPELTAERFIPDPFSEAPDARLYRTGDLCRWLPDGNIEFLGRMDNQVKIRGFRIELDEIEAVLGQHPHIQQSVVIVWEVRPDDKRLVAYAVPNAEPPPTPGELRRLLGEKLPGYMVPATFVLLESIPLTPNGKIDRRRLSTPDPSHRDLEQEFIAPRTPLEETLAEIWAELLERENIGIHDNFFDLGGHSLLIIRLQSKLQGVFAREIPVAELFAHPTVHALAQYFGREPVQHTTRSRADERRARQASARQQRQARQRHRSDNL